MSTQNESSRWVPCPVCGGRSRMRVCADSVLIRFPLYCPKCKKETRIDVVQLKMVKSSEPDA